MPKHALDRETIAEFILDQLPSDSQLFLLDFKRLILRDFSRYEGQPKRTISEVNLNNDRVSNRYLTIMESMIRSSRKRPQSEQDALVALLCALNSAQGTARRELLLENWRDAASLPYFFPQNCFAYVAGAFFSAYLTARRTVRGFRRLPGHLPVYSGTLQEIGRLYSPDAQPGRYSDECGRFAEWLSNSLWPKPSRGRLYIAPVVCDGSFFGVLYSFTTKEFKSAITVAETQFRDMRYSLVGDVAERLSLLQDPFDLFVENLPEYLNVAVAVSWSPRREAVVYGRPVGDWTKWPSELHERFEQLPWQRVNNGYVRRPSSRKKQLDDLCRGIASEWTTALREQARQLIVSKPSGVLADTVIAGYASAGVPIRFGIIIPGKLLGQEYGGRTLELYFSEPPSVQVSDAPPGSAKLNLLLPLLQEIVALHEQVENEAHEVVVSINRLLEHEIRNTLELEHSKSDIDFHILRCVNALRAHLPSSSSGAKEWERICSDLQKYATRYQRECELMPWPDGLISVAVPSDLLYLLCVELGRNCWKHASGPVRLGVVNSNCQAQLIARQTSGDLSGVDDALASPDAAGGLTLLDRVLRLLWGQAAPETKLIHSAQGEWRGVVCELPV